MMESSEIDDGEGNAVLSENGNGSHEGEHHKDNGNARVELTDSVKLFAFCASINSLIVGYDQGITTHIGRLVQDEFQLSDLERGVFVASFFTFMVVGALGSPFVSDRFGRRTALGVASYVFLIGAGMMIFARSYNALRIARAFAGFGCGLGYAIDPLYIAEIAPASHRGEMVTWSYIMVTIGLLLGVSTGLIFHWLEPHARWRSMVSMGLVFPIAVIMTSVRVLVESPRFLVMTHRTVEARQNLAKIYPKGYNIEPILEDIKEALQREKIAEQVIGWSTMLRPTPAFRRMLLLGFGISFAQQAVGSDVLQYYALDLMEAAGIESPFVQNITLVGLTVIKLQSIVISSRVLDFAGRKPMLFLSFTGLAASLLLLGISFTPPFNSEDTQPVVAMLGLGLYVAFYGVGLGPISVLIPSEIYATCIRAKALSLSFVLSRGTAAVMSVYFITVKDAISWPLMFLILSMVCLFFEVLFYYYLPETKGHSLEDMSLYFAEITNDTAIIDAEKKMQGDDFMKNLEGGGARRKMTFGAQEPRIARV